MTRSALDHGVAKVPPVGRDLALLPFSRLVPPRVAPTDAHAGIALAVVLLDLVIAGSLRHEEGWPRDAACAVGSAPTAPRRVRRRSPRTTWLRRENPRRSRAGGRRSGRRSSAAPARIPARARRS